MHRFRQPLMLGSLFIAISTSQTIAAPALTLTPGVGHPKIDVNVSGSGFTAGEAVDVYFDTTDEFIVFTDSAGNLPVRTFTVPKDALPGAHWITAVGRKTGDGLQKAFTVRTDWLQYGFEPHNRGRNPYENVIDASNVGTLDIAWSLNTGSLDKSSPAFGYGLTYVAKSDGYLVALTPTHGLKWSQINCGHLYSSPTIARGNVYAGCLNEQNVYAFKATTGTLVWSRAINDLVTSSPVVVDNTLYIVGHSGQLNAINATTGTVIWSKGTGSTIDLSTPAVANGMVYFGGLDGYMNALDAGTGTIKWNVLTGGAIESSPTVANGVVYFGSFDHKIYALKAKTGETLWTYTTGDTVASSAAVLNNTVFIGSNDGKFYALDANAGTVKWATPLSGTIDSSAMSLANGVGYIGTSGGSFDALDLKTGAILWSADVPLLGRPVITDGIVYAPSSDGLYAFAIDAGFNAKYNANLPAPSYALLHPDYRLKAAK